MDRTFDDAVEQLSRKPSFTFGELAKLVPPENGDAAERMRTRLAEDGRFFCDEREEVFASRAEFFKAFEFVVTPDGEEIRRGILYPGHRFAAFVDPEVFISETILSAEGEMAKTREITTTLDEALRYNLLLGAGGIFDTFLAEHPENASLKTGHSPKSKVKLTVFDLKEFYARHDFEEGDALLCKISDYRRGAVEAVYLSGATRRQREAQEFHTEFSGALDKVIERFGGDLDIPDQLRYALFLRGKSAATGESLDEFMAEGSFEIGFSDWGESTLLRKGVAEKEEDDDGDAPVVPGFVGISKGETGDLDKLLSELQLPLTGVEIDSFILDMAYARELDYEAFFARVFGRDALEFADEGQEAVFHNYIEDRWEELTTNYQRYEDETKGPLRSLLLEAVSLRLSRGAETASLDDECKRRLRENTGKADELLALLNRIDYTVGEEDAENIEETIAALREELEDIYE